MKINKYILIIILTIVSALLFVFLKEDKQQIKKIVPKSASCENCNVIIVGYDTVAASHVSSLGYSRPTTPMLDEIAKQGYLFTNYISPAPWTVPSFMSLFTGLYPTEHKVINKFSIYNKTEKKISNLSELSGAQTLAEVFKKNGYITGGFTGDAGVSGQFGYKNGFDIYIDDTTFGSIENSSKNALDWLNKNKGKKFFVFLHGYDAHGQFKTKPDYKGMFTNTDYTGRYRGTPAEEAFLREEQLTKGINLTPQDVAFWKSLYDSKIRDGDDRFAKFWEEIKKMGLDKNTIIVILSDHGEEYYQHEGIDHGHTLYDELVHVPFVIKIPGMPGGEKISNQVSSLDVAPTLLSLLGINPDKKYLTQMKGTSLFPLIKEQSQTGRDVFLETDYRDFTHIRGIRTHDGWKYIITMQTGKEELYDLKNDPNEITNVIQKYPEIASKLAGRVRDHLKNMGDNSDKKWETGCLPVYVGECE